LLFFRSFQGRCIYQCEKSVQQQMSLDLSSPTLDFARISGRTQV
jgi:hypothetical protein